jgi:hypothetical protein
MNLFAYIDPGSGLLAWQMVLAACVGCLFYIKKCRTFIGGLVKRIFRRD